MELDSSESHQVNVLAQLAARITASLALAEEAHCHAWQRRFDAGEALLQAQKLVPVGRWTRWLRENCALSERTAFRHMQLVQHRAKIEAEIERIGELSLRAALKLVAKSQGTEKKKPKPAKPDLEIAWGKATREEKQRLLDAVTVPNFLSVISFAFRRELESRVRREKTESDPDFHLTAAFRNAMSHLRIAADSKTSPTVIQSQEKAALNALYGLARLHPEFNDLSIGFQEPARPKHRRAA